jgi:hypothetical protein
LRMKTTQSMAAATTTSVPPAATTVNSVDLLPLERLETRVVESGDVRRVGAGFYLLDTAVRVNRSPGVFAFPDGRVRVVYMVGGYDSGRIEVIGSSSIRMATCVEPSCTSVEVVELQSISPIER